MPRALSSACLSACPECKCLKVACTCTGQRPVANGGNGVIASRPGSFCRHHSRKRLAFAQQARLSSHLLKVAADSRAGLFPCPQAVGCLNTAAKHASVNYQLLIFIKIKALQVQTIANRVYRKTASSMNCASPACFSLDTRTPGLCRLLLVLTRTYALSFTAPYSSSRIPPPHLRDPPFLRPPFLPSGGSFQSLAIRAPSFDAPTPAE
jgi:hypothetical protein